MKYITYFIRTVFIACILMTFTSTLVYPEAVETEQLRYGGTLVWGTRNPPTMINPILTRQSVSMSLQDLIFNRLLRLDSKGEIQPDLAKNWDLSSDGKVYKFELREGIYFHDGVELTADDVKFTFEKMMDEEIKSPIKSQFHLVEKIEALDRYGVEITLKKQSTPFVYTLAAREIAPRHLLDGVNLVEAPFNYHPIGTGPFRFLRWTEDGLILEYNPDYHEGRPCLDQLVVRSYADNKDLWSALMRGEVDYAPFLEREDFETIEMDSSFKAFTYSADYYYAIYYNPNDLLLLDPAIREALAFAVDRQDLIERISGGYGLECHGPFHPDSVGFDPLTEISSYDPDRSDRLLKKAGWSRNSSGILEKKGKLLELRMLVDTRGEIYKKMALILRQQLQEVGIKLTILFFNGNEPLTDEYLQANQPQMYLRYFLGGGSDPYFAAKSWHSESKSWDEKIWGYKNEEVDTLFELGESMHNKVERKLIYHKIHSIIYEEKPACFLYFPNLFHAISAKFQNVEEYFTLNMPTYTIKDWIVQQEP